jgi:hypothetical protein
VGSHADTSLAMLHGLLGPVSCTGKPLCVADGTDTEAARIHVSK